MGRRSLQGCCRRDTSLDSAEAAARDGTGLGPAHHSPSNAQVSSVGEPARSAVVRVAQLSSVTQGFLKRGEGQPTITLWLHPS